MTEFRQELVDRMIKLYGFEHEAVVAFASYAENWEDNEWNDKMLDFLVQAHEEDPLVD